MTRFDYLDGAKLVNQFTIQHPEKGGSGHPLISACVPQAVYVDLFDIEISHSAEWQDKVAEASNPNYKLRSVITARGKMRDRITVFSVPNGKKASFEEIAEIYIKPLAKGHVGGKRRATTSDGISFAGASTEPVPEDGLMAEEPGMLMYFDPERDQWPTGRKDPCLCLEAYVDETEFNALIQRFSMTSAPIQKGLLRVLVELFEHEVDAFLAEPWHRKDYGMLLRGSNLDVANARARVETVQVVFQPVVAYVPHHKIDEDGDYVPPTPYEPVNAATVRKIEKRLKEIGMIVTIGLFAIFAILVLP
ncbi:hypothetical protein ACTJK5_10615 [Agrobacterium sp. 22094]|uniref:hypothetical protein n=1 Tax=Agrobacterium sp. 22094 TaxID=3453872 RepID=UPI003F86DC7A